jgi:hypothetical protein
VARPCFDTNFTPKSATFDSAQLYVNAAQKRPVPQMITSPGGNKQPDFRKKIRRLENEISNQKERTSMLMKM